MKYGTFQDFVPLIAEYKDKHTGTLEFLDVGGGNGEGLRYSTGFNYSVMEITRPKHPHSNTIIGDICEPLDIPDNTYDVVYSDDVFEHLWEPWIAAENMVRITKPGGIIVTVTLFAWRYHPVPVDTFRYTHTGLEHLFLRTGQVETLMNRYDIRKRRRDARGKGSGDTPPIDELGGWRENWKVMYVCRKYIA